MEHKDIDRLFQEKLKDMEVMPDPKVWNAIAEKLQKKKRRILPIWWLSSGVAVCFILGLFLLTEFSERPQIKDDFPVITKEIIKKEKKNKEIKKGLSLDNQHIKEIVTIRKKKFKEKKEKNSNENTNVTTNVSTEENSLNKIETRIFNNLEEDIVKGISFSTKIIKKEQSNNSEEDIVKGISSSGEIAKKEDLLDKKQSNKTDFIAAIATEKKADKKEAKNKWSVSPIVGFLKSNSFSQASALDDNLKSNSFSGENTVSYGINVNYHLNDKWALKTGIQLQKNSFTTNDVALAKSGIRTASTLENVVFNFNDSSNNSVDVNASDGFSEQEITTVSGTLLQTYGYIEIPLEVRYTFFSFKKIQTSIISGFSSLILNENTIIGEANDFTEDVGGAINLSRINFSGNVGFDFDVILSQKLNFNITPMLKTQFHTFSKNSNGFKPYNIGVYTGVRYKF